MGERPVLLCAPGEEFLEDFLGGFCEQAEFVPDQAAEGECLNLGFGIFIAADVAMETGGYGF